MFFRKSKLIRELREEIQRLRELLAEAIGARDAYREQAREAIDLAKEKHFPDYRFPYVTRDGVRIDGASIDRDGKVSVRWSADYTPPEVKHCPECNVSVRSDSWPQECPGCGCVFGFKEMGNE